NRGFRAAPATALLLAGRGLAARRGPGLLRFVGCALDRQHRSVAAALGPTNRAAAPLPAHEDTAGDEIALERLEDGLVHDIPGAGRLGDERLAQFLVADRSVVWNAGKQHPLQFLFFRLIHRSGFSGRTQRLIMPPEPESRKRA